MHEPRFDLRGRIGDLIEQRLPPRVFFLKIGDPLPTRVHLYRIGAGAAGKRVEVQKYRQVPVTGRTQTPRRIVRHQPRDSIEMLNSRRGLALQQVDNTKGDKRIRYGGVIVPALGYDNVSFSYPAGQGKIALVLLINDGATESLDEFHKGLPRIRASLTIEEDRSSSWQFYSLA